MWYSRFNVVLSYLGLDEWGDKVKEGLSGMIVTRTQPKQKYLLCI